MFLKTPGSIKVKIKDLYTVHLPPVPTHGAIEGWELKRSDQFWRRHPLPSYYDERREEEIFVQEKERLLVKEGVMRCIKHFDPTLEKYRRQEWTRRILGHWFMNDGVPVYITGSHYFYLQWSKFDHPENDSYPLFYENQVPRFYFRQLCFEDPWSLGYIIIGARGFGKTSEEVSVQLENITRPGHKRIAAIQSKSENDAATVLFKEKSVPCFNELPDFFKPVYSHGTDPEKKMVFKRESLGGESARKAKFGPDYELGNVLRFFPAKDLALDGKTCADVINDEVGKCVGPETAILLYSGRIKKAKDISLRDELMGPDSTPRQISEIKSGVDVAFKIIPKKSGWDEWTCSSGHKMALKWCLTSQAFPFGGRKYKKDETVVMTINSFLQLPKTTQRNLMLYKVGVEYPSQRLFLDPYLMGLWLGDGDARRMTITSIDPEIVDWLHQNFTVTDRPTDTRTAGYHIPDMQQILRFYRVRLNKHIPLDFLANTRSKRLLLLAGIIDTDGHASVDGNRMNCEITQKSERLALDIKRLATELGFNCSFASKTATMKRADGSIYSCVVYRLHLYGDLWLIPTKVKRKQFPKIEVHHKNRKNPLRSGFSVQKCEEQPYIGFVLDKDKLHLLADCQVTHNTDPKKEANVYSRTAVNVKVVFRNNVKRGLLRETSTVELMDKGGDQCYEVWKESNPNERDPNGYTTSKLYKYFVSATEVQSQFVDRHGRIPLQRAYDFIMGEREPVKNDSQKLSGVMRKNPITEEEAFIKDASKCMFDIFILTARIQQLKMMGKKMPGRIGHFHWVNDIVDGDVEFIDNPLTGKVTIWEFPDVSRGTRKVSNACTHSYTQRGKKEWIPCNDDIFGCGGDPIRYTQTSDNRASKMAVHGFYKFDHAVDTIDKPRSEWLSYNIAWKYHGRSDDPEDDYEQVIMGLRYYGHSILPESNIGEFNKHLDGRGYRKFRLLRKHFDASVLQQKKGVANEQSPGSVPEVQESYIGQVRSFIFRHGMRCNDLKFLEQCRDFDSADTTKSDLVVSMGYTLIAIKRTIETKETQEQINMMKSLFPKFDNRGNRSRLIAQDEKDNGDMHTIHEVLGLINQRQ